MAAKHIWRLEGLGLPSHQVLDDAAFARRPPQVNERRPALVPVLHPPAAPTDATQCCAANQDVRVQVLSAAALTLGARATTRTVVVGLSPALRGIVAEAARMGGRNDGKDQVPLSV